jgi:hypothetical protein
MPESTRSTRSKASSTGSRCTGSLGQEEVYVALRGSGTLEADGERYPIDVDHIVRVGPAVKRKITPGPDGLRLLALGGIPGEPHDSGGTL